MGYFYNRILMQELLQTIEWIPVLTSFVLTFGLGWLWYSPKMFYEKWRSGKGGEVYEAPMWMPMTAQAVSTLLLAIIVNIFMLYDNVVMTILVGITIAGFIKANGFYSGKTKYAISVEVGYIVAMVVVMILINLWL